MSKSLIGPLVSLLFITASCALTPTPQISSEIINAIQLVESAGFHVCDSACCEEDESNETFSVNRMGRWLLDEDDSFQHKLSSESLYEWWLNVFGAAFCVSLAAMAAGLTVGLLGLDPLMLLIKERAGEEEERKMASSLLPIVKQHHRLLVTLLLMNSIANEALPIFLESLVPASLAIVLSVTLVLLFGEIIPSAIFTGPNQMAMAHKLIPLVRMAMFFLYPIVAPIAALLDFLLHHEDDDSAAYSRGELSALIRIHYEERLASKRRRSLARESLLIEGQVGALDFTPTVASSKRYNSTVTNTVSERAKRQAIRAAKNFVVHQSETSTVQPTVENCDQPYELYEDDDIHVDEVLMAQGALQMRTKVALDVFTPMRNVVSIPSDMELTERNLVNIYAAGFTRVPVHVPGNKQAICGLLMTKQLIVVDTKDKRVVSTLPLRRPQCVSPDTPLVNLLNMFQTGGAGMKGGHMALVCARPQIGNKALELGQEVPETAGLMGIITLEDVLETLLQEEIYDEMDRGEREARRLATKVFSQWKRYVRRKKAGLLECPKPDPSAAVRQAVLSVIKSRGIHQSRSATSGTDVESGRPDETTALIE